MRYALSVKVLLAFAASSCSSEREFDDGGNAGSSGSDGVPSVGGSSGSAGHSGASPAGGSAGDAAGGSGTAGADNFGGAGTAGSGGAGGASGAAGSGGTGNCDTSKPFSAPIKAPGLDQTGTEGMPFVTPDQLSIYYYSGLLGDIAVSTRSATVGTFSYPTAVGLRPSGATFGVSDPFLSPDGTKLYYTYNSRFGTNIQVSVLGTDGKTWSSPSRVAIESAELSSEPWLSADGQRLYFMHTGASTFEPRASIATLGAAGFADLKTIPGLNDVGYTAAPRLTADEKTIYFALATGSPADYEYDIWTASRASTQADFSNARAVTELNGPGRDAPSWISADGCVMYLSKEVAAADWAIYVAKKPSL